MTTTILPTVEATLLDVNAVSALLNWSARPCFPLGRHRPHATTRSYRCAGSLASR
jgi:hypothetical protein